MTPIPIVIFVPGIMGSELQLNGESIWPGPISSLILPYGKIEELLDSRLIATRSIRRLLIGVYQSLFDDFGVCGFREEDGNLIDAAYDWRKSNMLSARQLARHVSETVAAHGSDAVITIVAHSMGGLVSRYFLESGEFDTGEGFANVKRLITLGTPHQGAALALPAVRGDERRLFLNADQVLRLVADPRYPAVYELLPQRHVPFAWDERAGGLEPADIYDAENVRSLSLISENIESAQKLHAGLNPNRKPDGVRYFCFAGTRHTTAAHVTIRSGRGGYARVVKIEQPDAGDGTVPIWSSALQGFQWLYVGGAHQEIFKDSRLREVLGALLGRPGVLAVVSPVQLTVRDKVLAPNNELHVVLAFPSRSGSFEGRIVVESIVPDDRGGYAITGSVAEYPLRYAGVSVDSFSTVLRAPDRAGYYRVAFYYAGRSEPATSDDLIVQLE